MEDELRSQSEEVTRLRMEEILRLQNEENYNLEQVLSTRGNLCYYTTIESMPQVRKSEEALSNPGCNSSEILCRKWLYLERKFWARNLLTLNSVEKHGAHFLFSSILVIKCKAQLYGIMCCT